MGHNKPVYTNLQINNYCLSWSICTLVTTTSKYSFSRMKIVKLKTRHSLKKQNCISSDEPNLKIRARLVSYRDV